MGEASTAEMRGHLLGSKIHDATVLPFPGEWPVRRMPQLLEQPSKVQLCIPVMEKQTLLNAIYLVNLAYVKFCTVGFRIQQFCMLKCKWMT